VFPLEHPSYPALGSWWSWFSGLQTLMRATQSALLVVRPSGLDRNCITCSFPESSRCRQQNVELVSLHNHMS
jgi:hypothetical protein